MADTPCPPEGRTIERGWGSKTITLLELDGEALTSHAWGKKKAQRELGLSGNAITQRIKKGWTVRDALTTPKGEEPSTPPSGKAERRAKKRAAKNGEANERAATARKLNAAFDRAAQDSQAPTAARSAEGEAGSGALPVPPEQPAEQTREGDGEDCTDSSSPASSTDPILTVIDARIVDIEGELARLRAARDAYLGAAGG